MTAWLTAGDAARSAADFALGWAALSLGMLCAGVAALALRPQRAARSAARRAVARPAGRHRAGGRQPGLVVMGLEAGSDGAGAGAVPAACRGDRAGAERSSRRRGQLPHAGGPARSRRRRRRSVTVGRGRQRAGRTGRLAGLGADADAAGPRGHGGLAQPRRSAGSGRSTAHAWGSPTGTCCATIVLPPPPGAPSAATPPSPGARPTGRHRCTRKTARPWPMPSPP